MKPLWITATSATHVPLLEVHFLPSFFACGMDQTFDLDITYLPDSARYDQSHYNDLYRGWIRTMHRIFCENPNRLIAQSGCDFRFYRPVQGVMPLTWEKDRADAVFCLQDGPSELCTCFFMARSTPRVQAFLYDWGEQREPADGQPRFNELIAKHGLPVLKANPEQYWTHGYATQEVWDGKDVGEIPRPPEDLILHHANWTIGAENKLALLNHVFEVKANSK